MNSAILINLDYERYASDVCGQLWLAIEVRMQTRGFAKHKRLFLSHLERAEAIRHARAAVAEAEAQLSDAGHDVFDAVREFYWFEYAHLNDLFAPHHAEVEVKVDYVDAITFFTAIEARRGA